MVDQSLILALQQAFTAKAWPQVQSLLTQAMLQLSMASAALNPSVQADSRAIYEIGALTAITSKDQHAFDRYISLLFPIYFDPKSSTKGRAVEDPANVLLGLYLLSLLVRNRVAEFHVTLEQIRAAPCVDAGNVYIQFAVQLQQCLVEGTYHRVVLARQQVPSPDYAWFIDALIDTIRGELATCLEKSFKSIDMISAARLLLLTPEQIPQLAKFAEQRGWLLKEGNIIAFPSSHKQTTDLSSFARGLIIQSMGYAQELEQII